MNNSHRLRKLPRLTASNYGQAAIDNADGGQATTTATFSEPGDYILRVQANDQSGDGGGGFQCCWSNAHVAVTVKPGVPTTGGLP